MAIIRFIDVYHIEDMQFQILEIFGCQIHVLSKGRLMPLRICYMCNGDDKMIHDSQEFRKSEMRNYPFKTDEHAIFIKELFPEFLVSRGFSLAINFWQIRQITSNIASNQHSFLFGRWNSMERDIV